MREDLVAPLGSHQVIRGTGLTYRQLDYWIRVGAIWPSALGGARNGQWRRWTYRDRRRLTAIANVMHDLHRFGLSSSSALVRQMWTELEESSTTTIQRGSVTIVANVDEVPLEAAS